MYTDTTRPTLAQEVVDNAVDEALAGMHAKSRSSCTPIVQLRGGDDGRACRRYPPEEKVPGVD